MRSLLWLLRLGGRRLRSGSCLTRGGYDSDNFRRSSLGRGLGIRNVQFPKGFFVSGQRFIQRSHESLKMLRRETYVYLIDEGHLTRQNLG